MTVLRGRVVLPDRILPDGVVHIAGTRIVAVRTAEAQELIAPSGATMVPGLVDLHCHGGGGHGFTTLDEVDARAAALHHRAAGTTSVVGTLVSDTPDRMAVGVETLAGLVEDGTLAGINVEGPFLAPSRCGAQDPAALRDPDPDLVRRLLATGRGNVRIMTSAPELPGAEEVARLLRAHGVVAAVGHTRADAETVRTFLADEEPGLVTHCFNGMPAFHHREPGPALGALRSEAVLELIGDGVHLADETVAAVFGFVGADRIALVSDAMAAAGMPDGTYRLGPQEVEVRHGVARLAGGGSIAGGTSHLLDQVCRAVDAGVDLVEAVRAASRTPARVLGLDREIGSLLPGRRADVLVLDEDLALREVHHRGERIR